MARLRDFYQSVVGWRPEALDMGGHSDFTMSTPGGKPVAGVCHALGQNADLPPVWLIYIAVENLDASVARCIELGGQIVNGPRGKGSYGRFCVIRDPAGAVSALFEPGEGVGGPIRFSRALRTSSPSRSSLRRA